MGKQELHDLIDKAAVGSIEAAEEIALGYFDGRFGAAPDYAKAWKWGHYAARKGSIRAAALLRRLSDMGYAPPK